MFKYPPKTSKIRPTPALIRVGAKVVPDSRPNADGVWEQLNVTRDRLNRRITDPKSVFSLIPRPGHHFVCVSTSRANLLVPDSEALNADKLPSRNLGNPK